MRALMYMVCAFVALWSTGIGAAIEPEPPPVSPVPLAWTPPAALAPPAPPPPPSPGAPVDNTDDALHGAAGDDRGRAPPPTPERASKTTNPSKTQDTPLKAALAEEPSAHEDTADAAAAAADAAAAAATAAAAAADTDIDTANAHTETADNPAAGNPYNFKVSIGSTDVELEEQVEQLMEQAGNDPARLSWLMEFLEEVGYAVEREILLRGPEPEPELQPDPETHPEMQQLDAATPGLGAAAAQVNEGGWGPRPGAPTDITQAWLRLAAAQVNEGGGEARPGAPNDNTDEDADMQPAPEIEPEAEVETATHHQVRTIHTPMPPVNVLCYLLLTSGWVLIRMCRTRTTRNRRRHNAWASRRSRSRRTTSHRDLLPRRQRCSVRVAGGSGPRC
jgi:hypothetical protein